jgi:hypothetical protein
MQRFSADYLTSLVVASPDVATKKEFNAQAIRARRVFNEINKSRYFNLAMEQDFTQGFASYIQFNLYTDDPAAMLRQPKNDIYTLKYLTVFISLYAPYWCYSEQSKKHSFKKPRYQLHEQTGSPMLPENAGKANMAIFMPEVDRLHKIMQEESYVCLFAKDLTPAIDFEITAPTNIAAKPKQIFDCFFNYEV